MLFLRTTIYLLIITVMTVPAPGQSTQPEQAMTSDKQFQRDPLTLFGNLRSPQPGSHPEKAFDLELSVNEAFGSGELAKLNAQQRTAVTQAFERLVKSELHKWQGYVRGPVLQYEINGDKATLLTMYGNQLVRLRFVARNNVWYIIETEDLDHDILIFADELRAALRGTSGRTQLLESRDWARTLRHVESLIAAEGAQPSLLLLKALALGRKQYEEAESRITEADYDELPKLRGPKRGYMLLKQIRTRWPDFAPAHYAFATEDFVQEKNPVEVHAALRHYTKLRPLDPRGWYWLGRELQKQYGSSRWMELIAPDRIPKERKQSPALTEAENAFREAVRLSPGDHWCLDGLFDFYLQQSLMPKLFETLRIAIQSLEDTTDVNRFYDAIENHGVLFEKESAQQLEALLIEKIEKVAQSKEGLRLLARTQMTLDKPEAGLKTMQLALRLEPEAEDYVQIARLNRQLHRYEAAVTAAETALKLDKEFSVAWFHLACALAQLGRKEEAIGALREYEAAPWLMRIDYRNEPDLQPLTDLPEFKALFAKYDEATTIQPPSAPRRKATRKRK